MNEADGEMRFDGSKRERLIRQWHAPTNVLFSDRTDKGDVKRILSTAQRCSQAPTSLTGARVLIVGMPNVGKSSLLNALRVQGIGKGKAAQTGAQPGITRKIATSVRITDGVDGEGGMYVVDTPGVFIPYVPDAEAMLKLALCGSVKDTIIPPVVVADYLLHHLNLSSPSLYSHYHPATNDITVLLDAVARKTGRLQKGGVPDLEATALWLMQRWRCGEMGRFVLDQVTEEAYQRAQRDSSSSSPSINQARRAAKASRKASRSGQQHLQEE